MLAFVTGTALRGSTGSKRSTCEGDLARVCGAHRRLTSPLCGEPLTCGRHGPPPPRARRGLARSSRAPVAVARHRREVQQHREPRRALDEGADRRTPEPEDEIPLPVPRNRAVICLSRALADHHLQGDEGLALPARARHGSGGGVYLWESREAAERMYTADWKKMIADRYGTAPQITYFETPGDR